jgi:ubiquinone/menaquinone biosynthesis C-methylase UbiE/ribosomal protein S18 acetylase RimI-like enzyme
MGIFIPWQRARDIRREAGTTQMIASLLRKVSVGLVECGTVRFFARQLDRELAPVRPLKDAQLRLASIEDVALLVREGDPSQASEEMVRDRFERGDLCFIAESSTGELVHSRWVAGEKGFVPEVGMEVLLEPGAAYMYGGYTSPRWRRAGVDSAVRSHIFSTMRARGCSWVYSYVRGDSPTALRAAKRLQSPVSTVWYLRIGSSEPWLLSGSSSRPALRKPDRTANVDRDRLLRLRQAREWFGGWIQQPAAFHSTGFHRVSEEQFEETARHIGQVLQLDPARDCVLDVGCASAMVSRRVAPRCRQLVGVDMTAGMVAGINQESIVCAGGKPAIFSAADGRRLPFPSRAFDKVYSSAVIHMLPGRDDGLQLIEEMVRVCRPGGTVLVASVPDRGKRFTAYTDALKQTNLIGKARILASFLLPRALKNLLRGPLGLEKGYPAALVYDIERIAARMEASGLQCSVLDFPQNYWSPDFRRTRSNLLISVPGEPQGLEREAVWAAKAG